MNRRQFLKRTLGGGTAVLMSSYPFCIERYIIKVNQYTIPVPNLPREFNGFRVLHLTDLHHGPLTPLSILTAVIQKANELEKDIVVCTGDYVRGTAAAHKIDAIWPIMMKLRAREGVFTVLGNHDHWASTKKSLSWLDRSGHINLRQRALPISRNGKTLWLGGAGDLWEDHMNLDTVFKDVPEEECKIALAHNPDTADTGYATRIDLMISGHTHGGQVKIPFIGTPFLPVKNKMFTSGFISSGETNVFISRGIGWAGLPVRFNCSPEIAILKLEGSRGQASAFDIPGVTLS